MFEILAGFVSGIISKIFEKGIDIKSQPLEHKHKVFIKVFELYKALYALEETSKAALQKFQEMQKDNEVVVRTHLERIFEELFSALKRFIGTLADLRYALSVYIPSVYIDSIGVVNSKLKFLQTHIVSTKDFMTHEKINTASQLIPQPERSAGGGVTTMVSYPIEFPDIDRATMLDRELNFDEKTQVSYLWMDETSEKVKNLNKNFMQSVKRKTINFDNKSELREAIRDAGANIQQIEQMRMRLALFIKENIPMNEIIV